MLKKVLLGSFLFTSLYASEGAKFLVVENELFDKINTLNILDGGIKKKMLINSTKLSTESMKKYYPEFFLYDAKVCTKINEIKEFDKKPFKNENIVLSKESEIKDEIKKIKLLQILNDYGKVFTTSKPSKAIILSTGVICGDDLVLRGKTFKKEMILGDIQIKSMNQKDGILYVKTK